MSLFYHFRDVTTYWSKIISVFIDVLHTRKTVSLVSKVWKLASKNYRVTLLPDDENCLFLWIFFFARYRLVTDA